MFWYLLPLFWLTYWHCSHSTGIIMHDKRIHLPWRWSILPKWFGGGGIMALPSNCCLWAPWLGQEEFKMGKVAAVGMIAQSLYLYDLKKSIQHGSYYVLKHGIKQGFCDISQNKKSIVFYCHFHEGKYNYIFIGHKSDANLFIDLANKIQ